MNPPEVVALKHNRRVLIQSSSHCPWSVDVVRAVPRRATELLPHAIASCAAAGWSAITTGDGYIHVWQSKPKLLDDTLEAPKLFGKVFWPELMIVDSDTNKVIHLAISPSHTTASAAGTTPLRSGSASSSSRMADTVNLFAWHAGVLYVRKLSTKDLAVSNKRDGNILRGPVTKTRVLELLDNEDVTTLTAAPGLVVLSTSMGNLFWITLTPVPLGLHVQKVAAQTGWLSRVVFGSGDGSSSSGGTSPCWVLPFSATEFMSISKDQGNLLRWKVTVTLGTAHHATFEPVLKGSLGISRSILASNFTVLQAALAADQQSFHCIVSGTSPSDGDSKMYWVQAQLDGKVLRTQWISRFAEPAQVVTVGMIATENENAYAAFYQPSVGTVIIMALLPDQEIIQEVDLPEQYAPKLLPNMLERDTMTHGCAVLTTLGLGLRIRYMPHDVPPSAKKARYSSPQGASSAPVNATLVSHLRSAFWQAYQDPETTRPLPPSLRAAQTEALEQAIVTFATELQHKGDAASAQNPMEWHRALVKFLQERGLYRSISQEGRWQLLSIGQELAVFGFVTQFQRGVYASGNAECKSYDLADWLLGLQEMDPPEWNALLGGLLDVAMAYREDSASVLYDVLQDVPPPQPVWTSHKSLQTVLRNQLKEWRRNPASVERLHAEPVVKAALLSYSEFHPDKVQYTQVQNSAIRLLRDLHPSSDAAPTMSGGDDYTLEELAFDLSIQYKFFQGICQISVDHEKKRDAAAFSLDPLFDSIQGKEVETGYTFAQYVLQWHTDRGLYGHAINYGRHAPDELNLLMNQDERLRQYKWIPAVRQSYFDQATESCLANCELLGQDLASTQWALSMAKLANKLVATQNKERQQLIDRKLDLVSAQQMLHEGETGNVTQQTPEELVHLALQRLQGAGSKDDRVRFATIALAICNAMEDNSTSVDFTAQVWADALKLDEGQWITWLQTESDLSSQNVRDRMMETTVFGALLQECRKDESMSVVTYGRHLESAVIDKVGGGVSKLEFSRLLRSVSRVDDSIQAQSLVVASY